jgi:hypothetical protein
VDSAAATASAAAASASAIAAAASEVNAAASEVAAGVSEVNAAASEAAAALSAATVADFETRYLGAKSSDPTLDNDGNALVDGALYFDTANNVLKVYDLGTTAWLRTTPTSGDQANINAVTAIAADVTAVAGISTEVVSVSAISADVSAVAAIDTDVTTVAGISGDVVTVAANVSGVNSFAERYRVGTADPTDSLDEGDLFYNTSSNLLKVYNGTAWETGVTPGSGFLGASNNLSDVADADVSRGNLGFDNVQVIGANTNAVNYGIYVITADLTLTLPSSPSAGDRVSFANHSTLTTVIIGRNGSNIMSLAEDLVLDNVNAFGTLVYADATRGWIFQ